MTYETLEIDGLNMPWNWEPWQWWALMLLIIFLAPFWVKWIENTMDWIEGKSYDISCRLAWRRKRKK